MRRFNNKFKAHLNVGLMHKSRFYVPSPIDKLRFLEYPSPVSGDNGVITRFTSDIYLLFNQERLSHLGKDTVDSWLESIRLNSNSAYNQIKQNISDDDLISLVKSKYIQSPSELMAWSNYLMRSKANIIDAIKSKNDNSDNDKVTSDVTTSPTDVSVNNE